jgi:hypothetical protein
MVKFAQSYEIVRNFNNFHALVILVENIFLTNQPLLPVLNILGKHFYDLVKILGKVGQNMTTPPPNVDAFATSLGPSLETRDGKNI